MNSGKIENYSQDGHSFQDDIYRENNSVSNVLNNTIDDNEESKLNEEQNLNEEYKDADDLDPDDYTYNDSGMEESDNDFKNNDSDEEDNSEEDNFERDFTETNLDNDRNEIDHSDRPSEF